MLGSGLLREDAWGAPQGPAEATLRKSWLHQPPRPRPHHLSAEAAELWCDLGDFLVLYAW